MFYAYAYPTAAQHHLRCRRLRNALTLQNWHLHLLQVQWVHQLLKADLSQALPAELVQQSSQWVAPDWFQRSTTKYWLQPHHRMRVKCEIIKNLPVCIYGGDRQKLAAGQSLFHLLHQSMVSEENEGDLQDHQEPAGFYLRRR